MGSGTFRVITPWIFEIDNNPLIRGETSDICLCDWRAGVFTRLHQALVADDCLCSETHCSAQAPKTLCRFNITRAYRDPLNRGVRPPNRAQSWSSPASPIAPG